MLTRAYDAIMASLQVPIIINQNVDFNASAIDDGIFNYKCYSGAIRTADAGAYFNGSAMNPKSWIVAFIPFACWSASAHSVVLPDEDESEPNYEDYSVPSGVPSGWTVSSTSPSFEKTYDPDTKEIVCSVKLLWQNTSGAAKTVYGVMVRCQGNYRPSYSNTGSPPVDPCLLCREHFASPVVVEDQGIIALTFTYRVGRAGLVSATAASAE